MAFDRDQRAAPEFFAMLPEEKQDIFADAGRAHIVEPELDDAGQCGAGLKKQLGEIKVLSQHHGVVFIRPKHDVRVRGIGRTKFAPMTGGVAVLLKIRDPRKRQAVVNDNGHAG